MIEAIQLWNEPNNAAYWDATQDPDSAVFAAMTARAAQTARALFPAGQGPRLVLGGLAPGETDGAEWLARLRDRGTLAHVDAVAVHGYPLDWSLWPLSDWPRVVNEVKTAAGGLPVWVTEAGASTFGADFGQQLALERTPELLAGHAERVYWNSLLDLPPSWETTSRHREVEGSSYYRLFYLGLLRADGTAKPVLDFFDPAALGVCQWFGFDDPRLDDAVAWLRRLGVKQVRTGIRWADWERNGARNWFDRLLRALAPFELTLVLYATPPGKGKDDHPASPPRDPAAFADFVAQVVRRYALVPAA